MSADSGPKIDLKLMFQVGRQQEPGMLQRGDTLLIPGHGECVVCRITPARELEVLSRTGETMTLTNIDWPKDVRTFVNHPQGAQSVH